MQKVQGGLGRGLGSLLPQPVLRSSEPSRSEGGSIAISAPQVLVAPMPARGLDERRSESPIAPAVSESISALNDLILHISPNNIVANPRQPRLIFVQDDLTDLMASVQEHGILQPLIVTDRGDGTYELIAGERRLRSARAVGLETVPVIVRKATDQQKLELALIENIQRADLNAVEEARAYNALIEEFDLTQEEVAGRVGKSRSEITNTVRLLDLASDMLDAVSDGRISKSHARTLLAEPDREKRRVLFERMLGGGVTVRKAEEATRKPSLFKDPNMAALEITLREKLGTKVTIDVKNTESVIGIHCYSREDLMEMVKKLSEQV